MCVSMIKVTESLIRADEELTSSSRLKKSLPERESRLCKEEQSHSGATRFFSFTFLKKSEPESESKVRF